MTGPSKDGSPSMMTAEEGVGAGGFWALTRARPERAMGRMDEYMLAVSLLLWVLKVMLALIGNNVSKMKGNWRLSMRRGMWR